jgi:OmpA-OmpF porin, OOP family
MRLSQNLIALIAFTAAAAMAVVVSFVAALVVESRSTTAVSARLSTENMPWAAVHADGLQVWLTGTAPNEAARFRAVNLAGSEVDAARVRDALEVAPARAIEAPRFSVEMLRNDDGIQLIGLLPETADGDTTSMTETVLADAAATLSPGAQVADMLETAAYPAPDGWDAALRFGLNALTMLPRSKISVSANRVAITAIADTEAEKRRLETELNKAKPQGLTLVTDISAPRPVLTPFTLRFVIDDTGARFDACAADTGPTRDRIIAAATEAGMTSKSICIVGLGVPSPRWTDATIAGIKALAAMGQGTITFSDADVTLTAAEGTPQATFDRVVGELQTALPAAFSLNATLPKKAAVAEGPAEFTATLAETGKVELRGRLSDDMLRNAVDAFAKAEFGAANVYIATRADAGLPNGWPVRVLAGIEALGELENGTLLVRADTVEVAGVTGSLQAKARITQLLSGKLGQGQTFKVSVTYDEKLDPLAALPTPDECKANIDAAVAKQKIIFTPGSAEIAQAAQATIAALADILTDCPGIKMEIAGHTDAQGSEGGNLALSQARAEAVLLALQGRGIDVTGLAAKGYGEATPIADNDSDTGREANRRIEFVLTGQPAIADAAATGNTAVAAAPSVTTDTAPSVAPTDPTQRPERRPENGQ